MLTNQLTGVLASLVRTYSPSNPPARDLLATPTNERHAPAGCTTICGCTGQTNSGVEPIAGSGIPDRSAPECRNCVVDRRKVRPSLV
jgi:hypothetical protein